MTEDRARDRSIDVKLDLETAVDLAEFFVARKKAPQALQTYKAVLSADPYRDAVRRRYAELHFALAEPQCPPGSEHRGQMLLSLMGLDVLTEAIEAAYIENLERQLSRRERLQTPGALVLGLGCGRSGSTTLASMLAGAESCRATHENPPLVHWNPKSDQIGLHVKRFGLLLDRFPLVFDSAHWWLNAAEPMIGAFENAKLIGLVREPEACARSFLKIKGVGRNAINHWVDHDGSFWKPAVWDRLYPSYDPARFGLEAPDGRSKEDLQDHQLQLVRTYVEDYNQALTRKKESFGERLLLVRTEELRERRVQDQIFDFVGLRAPYLETVLNRGSTGDGDSQALRY